MSEPDFDKMSPEEIAEYQKANCIFCKIIKGEIPSKVVFDDDKLICIMDIRPAYKGHVLMMTKEHYPFLPVIPPQVSAHMFRITKAIAKSLKSAIITDKVTVFIANGGVAGQQSPHFLYHIIPRENNDGLDNFSIPGKDVEPAEIDKLRPAIAQRLGQITQGMFQRNDAGQQAQQRQPAPRSAVAQQGEPLPGSQQSPAFAGQRPAGVPSVQDLAMMIMNNPELKELMVNQPEAFKQELERNPPLKKLFAGVDIDKLAFALRQAGGG